MNAITRAGVAAAISLAISTVASAQVHVFAPSPMDGAQAATGAAGTGRVNATLDLSTSTFSWHVTYSGMTGATTVAHFHGPALPGQNAGVQIAIGTSSPDTGSQVLTATQVADVLAGLWYVNIHTGSFPAGEIRGQVLAANTKVVLNEVMYDGVGGDDGQTFVELAAPAGTDLTDWQIISVEAGSATSCGAVNTSGTITLVGSAQPDGLFVVADLASGVTTVTCPPTHNGGAPDMTVSNCDFENGTDAVQLKHPTGLVVDAMTYGGGACAIVDLNGDPIVEGNAAFDVFGGFSLERWPQGADTDDNATDFTAQCSPSAGASVEPRALFSTPFEPTISGAAGGVFDLDMHTARPGSQYIVFAFLTNPTSKQTLSLPFDPISHLFISLATSPNPLVVGFVGVLDATGNGAAQLNIPPGVAIPAPIGLYFAGATIPINPNSIATNSALATIAP